MHWALLAATALLVGSTAADRILVLGETTGIRDTHSIYLGSLKDRGHQVTVRTADDATLALFKFGELSFEHLLIFAPGVQVFGGSLSPQEIANFIDAGGNVLVAASTNVGDAIRDLAIESGFEFDETGTSVIDHLNYDTKLDTGDHTTIVVGKDQLINSPLIVGDAATFRPVLFKGVALIADRSNHLALSIVNAAPTAYSLNPTAERAENPSVAGKKTLLVGGLQARNNARVVFTGSLEMFSDAYFNAFANSANPLNSKTPDTTSGNAALVNAITQWVLKENGVLRVTNVTHHLVGQTSSPQEYTILEDVEYAITIEELKNGKWVPFNGKDVQLEFVRIDPFVRTTLANNNGKLSTRFKLPDVYGVFKFSVQHRRIGYTNLVDVRQVSVRPLWHTQYERFIRSAYPYYASSFSMMVGVVLFSIVFLYHKEAEKVDVGKKKN